MRPVLKAASTSRVRVSLACLFVLCDSFGSAAAPQKPSNPIAGAKCSPGWHPTGSMSVARQLATATLLLDGRVLVVGGSDGTNTYASAEIYDPSLGNWSTTDSLHQARFGHTATL